MKISIQEEIIIPALSEALIPESFNHVKSRLPNRFEYKDENRVIWINLEFSRFKSFSSISNFKVSFYGVEKYILELGELPNMNSLELYKNQKEYLPTLIDKENAQSKFTRTNPLNDMEAIHKWKDNVINYLKNDGKRFIDRYSTLEQINLELNSLFGKEESVSKLPGGSIDHLFRFLIISKITNDGQFNEKEIYCRNQISKWEKEPWIISFNKLLSLLLY